MRESSSGSDHDRRHEDRQAAIHGDPLRATDPVPPRFGRLVDFYGKAGFERIRAARVAVVGLGGVGAHAALALARSGIGALILVDFDPVTASSLNRSPVAGPADIGRSKVDVVASEIARVCPDTSVDARHGFFDADNAAALLAPRPDWVIDAIDSLNPKVALLEYCVRAELPVASSMGASSRRAFDQVRWGDVSESRICPLARQVRQRLKRRGIDGGIACVYSLETPAPALPPDLDDRKLARGRVRNRLPSQISLPGIFGYALAGLVLERVAAADTRAG